MAQTGYTPILIYSSSTTSNAPAAGSLTNSTLGSELAINITDGKLFYKDNANAVQVIGWKVTPTSAGGTGLTSYTAGDTLYYATGTTLSKLAIGGSGYYMSSSGTAPQWSAPAALTKTDDTNVTLTLGGSASTALLNAASLTLGWTGQLAVSRGGTGIGSYTAGDLLYASGTTTLSKLAIGTANYVLTSSGSAPQWTAGSSVSVGTASNLLSNATTGVMQIVGPAASTTRVMTIPNANFTAARTDTGQTFTGDNTFNGGSHNTTFQSTSAGGYERVFFYNDSGRGPTALIYGSTFAGTSPYGGFAYANLATFTSNSLNALIFGNTENYPISVITNSVENWRFETTSNLTQKVSNKGINFTANSAAAGMTSQLLNWYEEGTFTPTVQGTTTAGTATYDFRIARYTRIGRMVQIEIAMQWNSGTGTGNLIIAGLPYTNGANYTSLAVGRTDTLALTAGNIATAYVEANSSYVVIRQYPTGGGGDNAVPYDAAALIFVAGCYSV